MFKNRVLIVMVFIFGISQSSTYINALMNHGKNISCLMIDCEESEQSEKHENLNEPTIHITVSELKLLVSKKDEAYTNAHCERFIPSYNSSPETPPPDAV